MSWNYRIFKEGQVFGIYETYYNADGTIYARTESPEILYDPEIDGDGEPCSDEDCREVLIKQLEEMLSDINDSPILVEPYEYAKLEVDDDV